MRLPSTARLGRLLVPGRSTVTLNVEADSVRLLAVRGRRVVRWAKAPLAPGAVAGGAVADVHAVAKATDALLDEAGVSPGRTVAALTAQRSVPRILEFPRMSGVLLDEAVYREMKRELPVPLEEMHISSQAVAAEDGVVRVFAFGLPRDVLDPLVRVFSLLGLPLAAADSKPLALVRAVARLDTLIVDIEPHSVDVVVVRGGVPVTIRTVALQGDGLELQDVMSQAGEELVRTVKFYRDVHGEGALPDDLPLSVTGSLAQDGSAVAEASTGLSVVPGPLPLDCPPDFEPAAYMVNVGLALKEV